MLCSREVDPRSAPRVRGVTSRGVENCRRIVIYGGGERVRVNRIRFIAVHGVISASGQCVISFFKMEAVRWTLFGLVGLIVGAVVVLYAGSAWRLSRTYEVAPIVLNAPAPSAENGDRLATLVGCKGCHGTSGGVLFDVPIVAHLVTPNLSRVAQEYSDAELARLIRAGVKRDGTSAVVMSTEALAWLADDDLADIIAWVRSLKRVPDADASSTSWGPGGRLLILLGTAPFSAEEGKGATPPAAHPTAPPVAVGDYLTHVVCRDCHRLDVEHEVKPGTIAPPLRAMAQGYDLAQFTHLMRTGKAIGERDVGMMSEVAKSNFTHFSDEEIAAMHAFLTSEEAPAKTQP